MKRVITYETLGSFAYSNDKLCRTSIKGIVLDFFGLGSQLMLDENAFGDELAEKGIVLLIPYNNPWAWMNNQAVQYTDELVDIIMEKYSLPADIPIVSSGGSMGGLSSLVYTRYAKRTPVACVSNCPVCDLPYHYTERPDLPRTLYSAFFSSREDSLENAMKLASPLHLVGEMPDIEYYIFHCEEDTAVDIRKHSEPFVTRMQQAHNVTYHTVPERGHCDLPDETRELYNSYIIHSVLNARIK